MNNTHNSIALSIPIKLNASQTKYIIQYNSIEAGFIITTNHDNNNVKIQGIVVNQELRGKGIAGESYIQLSQLLSYDNLTLISDDLDRMELNAIKVWDKLIIKNLAIKDTNNYKFIA